MKIDEITSFYHTAPDDEYMASRWTMPLDQMKRIATIQGHFDIYIEDQPYRSQVYIVDTKTNKIVGSAIFKDRHITGISNTISASIINILSSYRNKGLASGLYGVLISAGYNIVSDYDQSQYGRGLWLSMAKKYVAQIYNPKDASISPPVSDITPAYKNDSLAVILSKNGVSNEIH